MKIKNLYLACFSPTGSTRRLGEYLAKKLVLHLNMKKSKGQAYQVIDFTLPKGRGGEKKFTSQDLVIFALPTYAGRLPNKVLPFFQEAFHGEETAAIGLVTFGNRAFDDSLAELIFNLRKQDFCPLAACAIGSRHAFSDEIGKGRPDNQDLVDLSSFAGKIGQKIQDLPGTGSLGDLQVEGRMPPGPYYTPRQEDGRPAKFLKALPKTDPDLCTQCGLCAQNCPMGVIDFDDCRKVSPPCIKCQACIRICPEEAKFFDHPDFLSHVEMLKKNFSRRAGSKFFI